MKRDFAIAALLSVCCNFALAATSPLASTNDYYYTVPKTTNIFGRVMGENGDYRLVRNEDIAFINEAWEERHALARGGSAYGTGWPEGPLVSRGGGGTVTWWKEAVVNTCVVTGETMEARLVEASAGALKKETASSGMAARLVTLAAITNEYAALKKKGLVMKQASLTNTNTVKAVESWEMETWEDGKEKEPAISGKSTNEWHGLDWGVSGGGSKSVYDGIKIEDGKVKWKGERWGESQKKSEKLVGDVKLWMEINVSNTNDWLRGEARPKVVEKVHAYAAVYVYGGRDRKVVTYGIEEPRPGTWSIVTNSVEQESWSTNATVLVDLGEVPWAAGKGNGLVYEVTRSGDGLLNTAAGQVEGMPTASDVEGAAVVPTMEDVGEASVGADVWCEIKAVYLLVWVKPVTSLPGW